MQMVSVLQEDNKMINIDITKLSDEELEKKINELQKIVFGYNMSLSLQARDIFEQYKYEQNNRMEKKLSDYYKKKKKNIELEEDSPINIG